MNPINFAIAEHYSNVEGAINYLVGLYEDDVDVFDPFVIDGVMRRYGLTTDGFASERQHIVEEVRKRI
jgi:hypothetical protein